MRPHADQVGLDQREYNMPRKKRVSKKAKKLRAEIALFATVAIAILCLLGLMSKESNWFQTLFFGIASYGAFVLPVYAIAIATLLCLERFKKIRTRYIVGFSILWIVVLIVGTLFVGAHLPFEVQESFQRGAELNGGGILGDLLYLIFSVGLGNIGASIMAAFLLIFSIIIMFQVSILSWFGGGIKNVRTQRRRDKKEKEQRVVEMAEQLPNEPLEKKKDFSVSSDKNWDQGKQFVEKVEALRHSKKNHDFKPFDSDHYDLTSSSAVESSDEIMTWNFEEKPVLDTVPAPSPVIEEQTKKSVLPPLEKVKIEEPVSLEPVSMNDAPKTYHIPPVTLLQSISSPKRASKTGMDELATKLEHTLQSFHVAASVLSAKKGPAITLFEVALRPGVKISKVQGLSDDIALSLAVSQVRIAPIPKKSTIGIEVPNSDTSIVCMREVIDSTEFKKISERSKIAMALGKNISGTCIIGDLGSMPHLLIAGQTGSGKSVCVNTIINSILLTATPDEVRFLMIDPKTVELSGYNGIPHLIHPVVTEPKKAAMALHWAVQEMEQRYQLFLEAKVRDIKTYNQKHKQQSLSNIVVIIDELADLMMVASKQVEDSICRIAQKARAAGIHLIVATQRPSVDVITGLIKANIPSRIAFSVSSQVDSRTILDMGGAEKLLGKGDMLYYPNGASKPMRVQGAFMADEEVESIVSFILSQNIPQEINEEVVDTVSYVSTPDEEEDELLSVAIAYVIESKQASSSLLQRKFRVGYNRAARLIDAMQERGVVGASRGSKPREVLVGEEYLTEGNQENESE